MDYEAYLRSEEWQRRREAELVRAGNCCEFCGAGELVQLNVHHLNYDHLGREITGDLIVLCRFCHQDVHEHPQVDKAVRQLIEARVEQDRRGHARSIEERAAGLRAAQAILTGLERSSGIGEPELGEGYCMDCGHHALWRWTMVASTSCLALCRICRSRRKAVETKLEKESAKPVEGMDWVGEEPPLREAVA